VIWLPVVTGSASRTDAGGSAGMGSDQMFDVSAKSE
jgi:hypothetical protein